MIALLLALCSAGTLQQVHQLEWNRAPAVTIAAQAAAEDSEVRVAVALALGRLHRADALSHLDALRSDRDREVRAAAADALGWTPGSADLLRSWLDELPIPTGLAAQAAAERGVRVRAIEALGRQGDASDLPRLVALLAEPWPTSAAAADALGRLGRRKVDGVSAALPQLVDALGRPDPRTAEAAAYAVRRIGLADAPESTTADLLRKLERVDRPVARAWLVGALATGVTGEARTDLFVTAATDPSPLVRVAALDALGPDDELVDLVRPWLRSPDPWVRQAAMGALGRMGEVDALGDWVAEAEGPWDVAFAVGAAGDPLGLDWTREDLDPVVRGAALEQSGAEAEVLLEVARTHEITALRTAAVAALLSRESPEPGWAEALLGAPDVAVREGGLELLASLPADQRAAALVTHLRAERDLELLGTGLDALAGALEEAPDSVAPDDSHLTSALRRAWSAPTARVRLAAERVAALLEVEGFARREPPGTRELVLPNGSVVAVEAGSPVLSEVHRIRGARVQTSQGQFTLSLDPLTAPLAVANFARLAEAGFFDDAVVHRVVPGFVVQTGCPRGDGWGGPGWTLPDEVSSVPYDEGSLGMARSAPWDTGGSQWFVTTGPTPHLVGDYTRFGEVVQGMHVVRGLERGHRILGVEIERISSP